MVTDTPTASAAGNQPPAADNPDAQATQTLVNQGDTVRATWQFSLDAISSNIAYMTPEAKELLRWAFQWCIDPEHPIRRDEFCDRVRYDSNTIYKIYSGKYRHPASKDLMQAPDRLLKAIRDFRRIELQRARMGRQSFVTTPTVKRIYWAIDQARKSRRPVMVYGASQIGKTEAGKQNCIDFNHGKTLMVEVAAVNGLRGLLQAWGAKLGISPNANTPDLIERITKAMTQDMVVIFDEVHLLANVYRKGSFFACMEQLRRIWDAKHFGLVFFYTDLGYEKIEKERKRELMQIFRRGVLSVNLGDAPSVADVRAIVESHRLPWDDRHEVVQVDRNVAEQPFAALKQLANENGITAIIERIRLGYELAADDGRQEVTWRDFLIAHFAISRQGQKPESGWGK